MRVGLRVDVDTHVGLTEGVPRLLEMFARQKARATFYVAMGPDNSGKAVFGAIFKPGFLSKMFRTNAASSYGLRTILSGTLLPARIIGASRPDLLKRIISEGHELGPHSWDHRKWQDKLDGLSAKAVEDDIRRAFAAVREAAGFVKTSAAPAWLTNETALACEDSMGLDFASDCRGTECFFPRINGKDLVTLQVPATLPTLDEMLGVDFSSPKDYYGHVAGLLDKGANTGFHVLTIHAELEGRGQAGDFEAFLESAGRSHEWVPLGAIAAEKRKSAGRFEMSRAAVAGRHGTVSMQGKAV